MLVCFILFGLTCADQVTKAQCPRISILTFFLFLNFRIRRSCFKSLTEAVRESEITHADPGPVILQGTKQNLVPSQEGNVG
ncbi:hypothetical protein V5799_016356 [Amblyomma americanum]|uniref:Secreted protein n=1 Tax=Amblyomma americanum TaxID=6943 RepID=A0AAQ4F593_AMBAM